MSRRFLIAVALAAVLPGTGTLAFDCARTEATLGRGPSSGVAVAGDLALISAGTTLVSFDLTDPAAPVQRGETRFGTGAPYGEWATPLTSFGGLVLVTIVDDDGDRLAVIDPAADGDITEIGSLALAQYPTDAVVAGDHAWLATSSGVFDGRLVGVDLADPAHPEVVVEVVFSRAANAVATAGDLVVVTTDAGLLVVDVSTPVTPAVVGWLRVDNALAVAAVTGHAFVADRDLVVHVVDLADPSNPTETATLALPHVAAPGQLVVAGDRLYAGMRDYDPSIAGPDGGIAVLDISDPEHPTELGFATFSSGAMRLALAGDDIVAADEERGLRILSVAPAGAPTEIARRNVTRDDAFSVAVVGDLAFVGDQGLRIVDIHDHRQPLELAAVELDGEILAVAASPDSGLALALTSTDRIAIIDVTAPAAPRLRSFVDSASDPAALAVAGELAVIADGADGLLVIDLADPMHPVELGRAATSGLPGAVTIAGTTALVGLRQPGDGGALAVFDLSLPSAPSLIAQLALPDSVSAVTAAGDLAAVFTAHAVHAIDLSNPAAPLELGSRDAAWPNGAAFDGRYAYSTRWPGSLTVFDLAEPSRPFVTGSFRWEILPIVDGGPLGGYGVAIHRGAAVVADGRHGLRLVSVDRCLADPAIPSDAVAVDE